MVCPYLQLRPVQGYLAHKKHPPSLGPSYGPRHRPAVHVPLYVLAVVVWSEREMCVVLSCGVHVAALARAPGSVRGAIQGYLAHKKTPTPLGPP